jgi:hypothetical protein
LALGGVLRGETEEAVVSKGESRKMMERARTCGAQLVQTEFMHDGACLLPRSKKEMCRGGFV